MDPLGTGHGYPRNWSRIPYELVTDTLGTGHGSPRNCSRIPCDPQSTIWEPGDHFVKVLQPLGGDFCTPGDEFYVFVPVSLVGVELCIKDPGSI